jgi:hypothetical protein
MIQKIKHWLEEMRVKNLEREFERVNQSQELRKNLCRNLYETCHQLNDENLRDVVDVIYQKDLSDFRNLSEIRNKLYILAYPMKVDKYTMNLERDLKKRELALRMFHLINNNFKHIDKKRYHLFYVSNHMFEDLDDNMRKKYQERTMTREEYKNLRHEYRKEKRFC